MKIGSSTILPMFEIGPESIGPKRNGDVVRLPDIHQEVLIVEWGTRDVTFHICGESTVDMMSKDEFVALLAEHETTLKIAALI